MATLTRFESYDYQTGQSAPAKTIFQFTEPPQDMISILEYMGTVHAEVECDLDVNPHAPKVFNILGAIHDWRIIVFGDNEAVELETRVIVECTPVDTNLPLAYPPRAAILFEKLKKGNLY